MKKFFALAVVVLGMAATSGMVNAADTYQIDPGHSTYLFRVKHMNVSYTHGRINTSSGTVVVDNDDPSKSSVNLELKVDSIDTFSEKRDQHLKGPDFFNAKQFPTITFKSKAIKKAGDNLFDVTGDFTLMGVTKELTLKFEQVGTGKDPWGGFRTGFEGIFNIKRSDYGMKGMMEGIGDDIQITVSIEGVRKA